MNDRLLENFIKRNARTERGRRTLQARKLKELVKLVENRTKLRMEEAFERPCISNALIVGEKIELTYLQIANCTIIAVRPGFWGKVRTTFSIIKYAISGRLYKNI